VCSNYRPVTRMDRVLTFFGIERERDEPTPPAIWPLGFAPYASETSSELSGNLFRNEFS
jgi:hypothetical protein